jgi:hypoxanthine phosphoribosyltransferase
MSRVVKLFAENEIAQRLEDLSHEIVETVSGEFTIVGLLKGCFVFVADLIRALDRAGARPQVEFLRLGSYGLARHSGQVHLVHDIPTDIGGRRVLLVDDIVDTGRSIACAQALLRHRGIAELWTCALVDKPSRREVDVALDFFGFVVDDVFIAGYGIDYAERYRHLPYIGIVD